MLGESNVAHIHTQEENQETRQTVMKLDLMQIDIDIVNKFTFNEQKPTI